MPLVWPAAQNIGAKLEPESVGKIKNRKKWGYQNHSTRSENALERKYGPKIFGDSSLAYFSD
ncbi:MAG TPA: hypothetical protein VHH35_16955, partial [Pyrinomonadaceae bacterium]|nr:hypothetical protein [Pyrinomonadaceae bacterium]